MIIILKGGRVIDPRNRRDEDADIWMEDGQIIAPQETVPEDAKIYDLAGKWVVPGLIDMHVHLRDPGEEYKESIVTGTDAAAAGGFTAVACMPNTDPVNDTGSVTRYILEKSEGAAARVYPVGALSEGLKGESLAEYADMKHAGAVALTDDGNPVVSSQLMRRAMEYAKSHDMLVISHSEEPTLSKRGCMNEGLVATRLGLKGIPAVAESIMVQREIALAGLTGARLHIAHVSCIESLAAIRDAKKRGLPVTAETAPHYFSLTDDAVIGYDTHAKMNPPLRTEEHRQAIRQALADGTLDVIATDHAPHSIVEKEVTFEYAANGIVGLETSLGLSLALVRDGVLTPSRLVELMSSVPAQILSVAGGELGVGAIADVTVIDPELEHTFLIAEGRSRGANSPFDGWKLKGAATLTFVAGEESYCR
ncbi:dihydroorotase [Desulfotalea psychrophila]|uniref:Dihydroorotase n=1 Tax=Desulfotalea psychrophila (strain LSv54 / DSM 12343) TaxID=177439 RepID=PYRC_DESPS|nr:dihydroorotase [Desulfotalea psychrophila]Q6AS41.1 RecName: Full=Dihydroorotase; Short=DHOase [Desulfotalea psychrophila LSv54]CAG34834.1 probable dihydroorotase [Desulfotalea psychrophila LSv54]